MTTLTVQELDKVLAAVAVARQDYANEPDLTTKHLLDQAYEKLLVEWNRKSYQLERQS